LSPEFAEMHLLGLSYLFEFIKQIGVAELISMKWMIEIPWMIVGNITKICQCIPDLIKVRKQ
jgi:hypothetical protein